jgi:hypothetical protein
MIKRASTILAVAAVFATSGDVAGQTAYGLNFGLSQSQSDSRDFADDFSFRNVTGEFRQMLGDYASVGFSIGWHVFHEERIEQTDLAGIPVTASGLQFRTINTMPNMVTFHRYFGERREARAYAGVGAGLLYSHRRIDVGVLGIDNSSWDFGFTPEVGYIIPTQGFSEIYLNFRYQIASGDIGADAWLASIGIMSWPFRF